MPRAAARGRGAVLHAGRPDRPRCCSAGRGPTARRTRTRVDDRSERIRDPELLVRPRDEECRDPRVLVRVRDEHVPQVRHRGALEHGERRELGADLGRQGRHRERGEVEVVAQAAVRGPRELPHVEAAGFGRLGRRGARHEPRLRGRAAACQRRRLRPARVWRAAGVSAYSAPWRRRSRRRLVEGGRTMTDATTKPTIVLVHGAWADGSSWDAVTRALQAQGYTVLVSTEPLAGTRRTTPRTSRRSSPSARAGRSCSSGTRTAAR